MPFTIGFLMSYVYVLMRITRKGHRTREKSWIDGKTLKPIRVGMFKPLVHGSHTWLLAFQFQEPNLKFNTYTFSLHDDWYI